MTKPKKEKVLLSLFCQNNGLSYLLSEWDYQRNNGKTPDDYTYGSQKSVFWLCRQCGSSFSSRIDTRVRYRTCGCLECAKKQRWETRHEKKMVDHNIAIDYPNIANEWDYELNSGTTPEFVTKGSTKKFYWKCPKGHPSYPARVANRVYKGDGCPVCGGRKILVGYNDLETTNPFLACQWDYERNFPKTPKDVFPREGNKYWWICPICGESYQALVSNRSAGKSHDKCSRKGTSFPEQAIFYYVKKCFPDAISRDTSFGFELDIYVPSMRIAIEYDGVRYHKGEDALLKDNNKDRLCGKNSIRLFRFRDSMLPSTTSAIRITCQDNKKYLGAGIRQLISQIAPENRVSIDPQSDYYVIFNNTLITQKEKSIAVTHPEIAEEWHPTKNLPLTPDKITSGMGVDLWWLCLKCGNEYTQKMYSRKAGRGCPNCGKKSRAKERSLTAARKNNFMLQYPVLAAEISLEENIGLDISNLAAGSNTSVIWKCPKGHPSYPASVAHRVQGTGCPICGREKTRSSVGREVINLETGEHFASLKLAAESVGGDKRYICSCCCGKMHTAFGFHWQYADTKARKKHIGMLIHNVETNELFSSIQEAADKYGCNRSSISSALNGDTKTSMGYHWDFVSKE